MGLQNVMQTLKKEKEEHYRESRRDKEVMERILSDLENSFTIMQEEREDSLTQARDSTSMLSTELSRLHDQLEQTRGDKDETAQQGTSDREMLGRLVKDLEEQLGGALKAKLQSDMMIQAQKASHDKEIEKLNSQLDSFRAEHGELKDQTLKEKEVLGRMIKDMEEQCATAIREKAHFESLLAQASGNRSDMELAREEYKSMLSEVTADKDAAISMLRDEETYLTQQLKTLSDDGAASGEVLKATQEEIQQLKATQLQLSDLRSEHQALARDYADMETELQAARNKIGSLEQESVGGSAASAEQMNELRYQLVHDKAKMFGILKELEAQLREATGGEPTANLSQMMGEFSDTMGAGGGTQMSDGSLYEAMREYEKKLAQAQQDNTALRAQLASAGR